MWCLLFCTSSILLRGCRLYAAVVGVRVAQLQLLQPFYDPLSGTTQVSQYQKDKPFWILLKQTWWGGNMAVVSAEPYASYLHFAPEDNHASVSSLDFYGCQTCVYCVQFPFSIVDPEFPMQGSTCSARHSARERIVPPAGVHWQHPARLCRPGTDQQHAAGIQAREVDGSECARVNTVWGRGHSEGGSCPRHKDGATASSPAASH